MVRPSNFAFNEETAANNAFQSRENHENAALVHKKALSEFDEFVRRLRSAGINVIVGKDSATPVKPDAVFPNNWVSFHQEGLVITYPMFAPSRRRERRRQIIDLVLKGGYYAERRVNLEFNEKRNRFLEGTGSIVFDHEHQLAYACLSPRTDASLLEDLCREIDYEPVIFQAVDGHGQDIYHTNVMMAMGDRFIIICLDSVPRAEERAMLEKRFSQTGKTVIEISREQMNAFAGNMLQVQNEDGKTFLIMSEQAYQSLNPEQIALIEQFTSILYSPLYTIEKYGGGSARCMIAEIFLPDAPRPAGQG